eukprot:TRINITY_DN11305_c0_g1_i3.p1 TRINITY_DN11305_c0_g1~~TRINITY_DN11305_c0_g1_i3.p1  ORF type:complete len:1308 (+),score=353.97 TRINITY_DN11305_c0_g1_i3:32-3955(+)
MECSNCGTRLLPKSTPSNGKVFKGNCPKCGQLLHFQLKATTDTLTFELNGRPVTVSNPDPAMSLNEYLREVALLRGTKRSCGEGGCGCCVVNVTHLDALSGQETTVPINSCLRPLCSLQDAKVVTIEGLGNRRKGYHPLQTQLAESWGSQCGGCSTGMVMSAYSLLAREAAPAPLEVELALDGNICRCTGYRPILDAFKTVAKQQAQGDIEDVHTLATKCCTDLACGALCTDPNIRQQAQRKQVSTLSVTVNGLAWIQPASLSELVQALATETRRYMLTFGNTSTGVYHGQQFDVKYDMTQLHELKTVGLSAGGLEVGAGVTIAEMIKALENHSSLSASFPVMVRHLHKVANTPIRSAASWTGNLMICHDFADFPSDLATLFVAAGATLKITDASQTQQVGVEEFLTMDMKGKVIVSITIPMLEQNQVYVSHKVMKRHANAHAYVNAACLLTIVDNSVTMAQLAFGGLSSHPFTAPKTSASLKGLNLTDNDHLHAILDQLSQELPTSTPPAGASLAYRQQLACSLLYKCLLAAQPTPAPSLKSAADPYLRPASSADISFTPNKALDPVGRAVPKTTAYLQTAGEARYVADLPPLPNTLYAAFALSTVSNALLDKVDFSLAQTCPGVHTCMDATDLPPNYPAPQQAGQDREPLFVASGERVMFHGQAIGMVLADTQAHADAAAKLVTATYTDVQRPVLTLDQAVQSKSFFDDGVKVLKHGEAIDIALTECDKVITGSISCGSQYHFHMETQATTIEPQEDGSLVVYCSTQSTDMMRGIVADITGLPANKVKVVVKRLGGSYGGKITRSWFTAAATAYASLKLGVPVRSFTELHTNMRFIGKRHPFHGDYSIGIKDGLLHAIKADWYMDTGAYVYDDSMAQGLTACDAAYYCPNWQITPYSCRTNTPSNTAVRAPGCLPAIFWMETMIDHLATELDLDPAAFRRSNLYQKDQVTPLGMTLKYCSLDTLWDQFVQEIDLTSRRQAVKDYNSSNRWRKRGLCVQPNKYGLGWTGYTMSVFISVSQIDGTVSVKHGGVEMGQGSDVKMAQVVAYELGVPLEMIKVEENDTTTNANNTNTGGSATSDVLSMAAISACKELNDRLSPIRNANPNSTWPEIAAKAGGSAIDLMTRGWAAPNNPGVFDYNSYGMIATEVELDILTGETEIRQVDLLFDCGDSLNPAVDIGQVEGGLLMGFGYWLSEEVLYDSKTGALTTDGTWEYKPPSVKDIPIRSNIRLLPNAPNPIGVLRSKASGEPPLCMSSSVLFAIKEAVAAARQDATGTAVGYMALSGPATPERVAKLCEVTNKQLLLN